MNSASKSWKQATLAVREAVEKSAYGENSEALYLTSSFVQPDSATTARRFLGEEAGYTYSRYSNPTVASMEKRLAALEGTEAAIGTGSGMGAILMLCMGLLKAGDHVVCSRSVFGSTLKLIGSEFGKFGVESTFVSQTNLDEWKQAIRPNTKLLFAETPSNPLTEVCDIAALAHLAHQHGALLTVDNTFCTPVLQQPVKLGADIVMHSGTKYLDGQGRVVAGALCCSQELVDTVFEPVLRCAGMAISPFNAWVVLKGLETLSVRMKAQSAQALEMARWLEAHPKIERVYYPGLPSHPQHQLAMQQQNGIGGAVVSFVVKGTTLEQQRDNAWMVADHTELCSITANVGDVKTIITHPASTSHGRLSEEQRQAAGIVQGLLRLAVGLEDVEDIKADLARGLAHVV
ncbi:O-succinylhomoserine sulfhydrylase [Saezia sanguinis]|uniref:O-succinylhomoserine sulfhydrylase n=1 Tax=Saezia sanguinis TaxID=1965230 RepID=A0A433SGE7_9BURK|nr:O-succinylhomoserine sulfhydrylase [Saezia sanguinis]RUS67724.1 O-succinylhomoserine sulfhydrylase [Saezia sanguinis]